MPVERRRSARRVSGIDTRMRRSNSRSASRNASASSRSAVGCAAAVGCETMDDKPLPQRSRVRRAAASAVLEIRGIDEVPNELQRVHNLCYGNTGYSHPGGSDMSGYKSAHLDDIAADNGPTGRRSGTTSTSAPSATTRWRGTDGDEVVKRPTETTARRGAVASILSGGTQPSPTGDDEIRRPCGHPRSTSALRAERVAFAKEDGTIVLSMAPPRARVRAGGLGHRLLEADHRARLASTLSRTPTPLRVRRGERLKAARALTSSRGTIVLRAAGAGYADRTDPALPVDGRRQGVRGRRLRPRRLHPQPLSRRARPQDQPPSRRTWR